MTKRRAWAGRTLRLPVTPPMQKLFGYVMGSYFARWKMGAMYKSRGGARDDSEKDLLRIRRKTGNGKARCAVMYIKKFTKSYS